MEYRKSVLVKNATQDCTVTLFIYSSFDPICWLSSSSKILQPGEKHLYRSENGFKYEIKSINNGEKKNVLEVKEWKQNAHFNVYRDQAVESKLEEHPQDMTVCIRKSNVEKEASLGDGRNLYEILKLNYEDIRKLDKDKQDVEIKKAFHREIRRWHSDVAGEFSDNAMAHEVLVAFDILRDREKRADYHNKADYSKGWLSDARWRSIFKAEWETEEQRKKYIKRLGLMALSLGIGVGGLVLTVLTAGAASPVVVAVGGTIGAGLFGGGVQSGLRTITSKSIERGCDVTDYAKSFGLGFAGGAVTGGATVGITAGITGIGSAATETAITTIGQHIGIGAASAAAGGAAFTLASDLDSILVDGVNMTWKQVTGHVVAGALIGGVSGSAVGAVSGAFVNLSAEVSSATPIEERLVPGIRKLGLSLAKNVSKSVTDKSTESVLGSVAAFIEERVDDDQENRPVGNHLADAGKKLVSDVVLDAGAAIASTTVSHASNEITVKKKVEIERNNYSDQQQRQKTRYDLDKKTVHNWNETKSRKTYKSQLSRIEEEQNVTFRHNIFGFSENISTCTTARFKYISRGIWISKMVIEYKLNKENHKTETTAWTGDEVAIPIEAEDIKVYFQVLRFIWCNVTKWNRFTQRWHEEPHIFKYNRAPEQRTFTLDGPLCYEKVVHITDERYDDVDEV